MDDHLRGPAPHPDLLDGLPVTVFTARPDGSCDHVSEPFYQYTGMAGGSAEGWGWAAALHPDDAERVKARWLAAVRTGRPFESAHRFRRADGKYGWFLVRSTPVTEAGGKAVRWLGVCTDVDAWREEVGRPGLRMAALVESCQDAIIGKTLAGTITSWNPSAERLFGYAAAEAVGRPIFLIVPDDRRAEVEGILERLRRGEPMPPFETVRQRKDGRRVTVFLTVSPFRDAAGDLVGAWAVSRDVTAMRRLEEQFRQAQKMEAIGRLAGGVAHDFNNLLTVILGYSDLLLGLLPTDSALREPAEQVRAAGDRAAALTRQLLTFSRQQVVEPRLVDVNALVGNLEKMLRRLLGEDVDLAIEPDEALGPVLADPGQLEQVVMNLAVNARHAMPQGGKLTLGTKAVGLAAGQAALPPGRYCLLTVSDTGCGMTEEVKAHLFEPFFTTKEPGKGTGLGLATAYGIVQQAGGHIDVYSEPGAGACFKVYLPEARQAARAAKTLPGVMPAPRGSETILLAEDEDRVRALVVRVLREGGYTVLEARDGAEALALGRAHAGPLHLLITDVVMPGAGGRALAERLQALRPGLRVLFLSGYTDDAVVRHGVLEEGVPYLQKPFSPNLLAHKVREVLDRPGGA